MALPSFTGWEFSLVPLHLLSRQGKNEKIKHHTQVIYGPVVISTHIPMARTQFTQPHCCLAGWPGRKGDKICWTHSSPCPMAELTKIGQVIGKEVNNLLSLKLYKQSLVTLCLGYAVGVGGGLSSQKNERTFFSVRFSDLVKQQRIGTKLPSWISGALNWVLGVEIEHCISFHKLFFQLDVLEVFSTRDHTWLPATFCHCRYAYRKL